MTPSDGDSVFAVINSWLTPPFLFLYLNLTIGTIVLISSFATHKNQPPHHHADVPPPTPPTPLARAASLLERVRSFDFSSYDSSQIIQSENHPDPPHLEAPPHEAAVDKSESKSESESESDSESEERLTDSGRLVRAPSLLDRLKSFGFSLDKFQQAQEETVAETFHDEEKVVMVVDSTEAGSDDKLAPKKLKKSWSSRGDFGRNLEKEEEIDRRRPATVREKGRKAAATMGASVMVEEEDQEVDAKADDFINKFKHQLKLQRLDSLLRYKQNHSA